MELGDAFMFPPVVLLHPLPPANIPIRSLYVPKSIIVILKRSLVGLDMTSFLIYKVLYIFRRQESRCTTHHQD